jgi:hypothetical protein
MSEPNTSLAELFRLMSIDAAHRALCVSAGTAALNNSQVAARRSNEATLKRLIDEKNGKMWVIAGFEKLKGKVVGSGQCPGIVQSHGGLPLTKYWFEGPKVKGVDVVPKGTAIATFVNGKYPNASHGNHVAIYIDQDPVKGLLVFDQWTGRAAGYRWMKWGDGVSDRSNDGAAMSIILTAKDG